MWCRGGNAIYVPSSKPVEDVERWDDEAYRGVHREVEPPVDVGKMGAVRLGLPERCGRRPGEGEEVREKEHRGGDFQEQDHGGKDNMTAASSVLSVR